MLVRQFKPGSADTTVQERVIWAEQRLFETGCGMTHPFVMIDGYNLMHAVGLARRNYGPGDLQLCRNRLLQQLASRLSGAAVERTTVVFDAFGTDDSSNRRQVRKGIQVVYAPAGTDADSELERMITAHSAPKRLLVVSSDHRLQRAAQRRKSKFVDSDVFWGSLDPDITSSQAAEGKSLPPQTTAIRYQGFDDTDEDQNASSRKDDAVFDSDYLSDLESEFDH